MSAIETTRYPDIRNYIGGAFVDTTRIATSTSSIPPTGA